MLWRRHKRDGFVWEKHVRTVIVQRREARARQREAVAEALRDGGRRAGEAVNAAARETGTRAGGVLSRTSRFLAKACRISAQAIGVFSRQAAVTLGAWSVSLARGALRGSSVAASKISRSEHRVGRGNGGHRLQAAGHWAANVWHRLPRPDLRLPSLAGLSGFGDRVTAQRPFVTGIVILAGFTAVGLFALFATRALPSIGGALASASDVFSTTETISGRARAVTGDTLVIDGRRIQLADIDAPELDQSCRTRSGRRWRCGRRARTALRRLVRRSPVTCEIWDSHTGARAIGNCHIGEKDLAEQLLQAGRVFAARDAAQSALEIEAQARSARRGVWQGRAEHPAEYRERLWARAAARAPDGCPIKGRQRRGERVYVTPWSSGYRRTRVRESRGDRWFCTEAEAIAAGWRAA